MVKLEGKVYNNHGNQAVLEKVPVDAKYILDVGCGDGTHARSLGNRGCIVDGITLSIQEKEISGAFCREVFIFDLENGLPNTGRQYDAVICSHVLEHICYPDKLLYDIKNVLKPGGTLIVALPNIMNYKSRWQLMLGNFNYAENGIWDNSHFKWYTFKTGQELLRKAGYSLVYSGVDGDLPLLTVFGFIPARLRKTMYSCLTFLSKGLFGGQLIYTAKAI